MNFDFSAYYVSSSFMKDLIDLIALSKESFTQWLESL